MNFGGLSARIELMLSADTASPALHFIWHNRNMRTKGSSVPFLGKKSVAYRLDERNTSTSALKRGLSLSLLLPLLCSPFLAPCSAIAQSAHQLGISGGNTSSSASSPSSPSSGSHSSINLDLSSTQASLHARNSSPVSIQVGGNLIDGSIVGAISQTIAPAQLLTPAEFLAVNETLHGGQTLLLNNFGQAIGGYATVSSNHVHQLASLVVPQNVVLDTIGFNANSPLSVSGNVSVLGSLHSLQSTVNTTAVLNTANLFVGTGGLISGSLPQGQSLGTNIFASSGLTINAVNNVANFGAITSAGSLNINAGGSITNQSSSTSQATMIAQNVSLVSGVGQIVNSGLIQAQGGSVNLGTANALSDLTVDNSNGVIQALASINSITHAVEGGAINLRDSAYSGSANTNLKGGNWLSNELNFNSGQGAVTATVGQVTGAINANAGAAHIYASTPQLVLGNTNINGDPTYVNAGGDIQLAGTDTETEDLAIIASGNITASGAARIVDNGHNVWLIAGAKVDIVSGACTGCGNSGSALTVPPGTANHLTSGFVTVSEIGAPGGNIDLRTGNTLGAGNTVIDTSATLPNTDGGNVTLIANSNGPTSGQILFPTTPGVSSVTTSAKGTGINGNVIMFAGANSGQGISVGAITTNGGTGQGGGQVLLYAGQPHFVGGASGCGSCMSFNSSGTATGGLEILGGYYHLDPVNSSIEIYGPIRADNGSQGGTIVASTPNGDLEISSSLSAKVIFLSSSSGNIGTISTPIQVNNGGGGLVLSASSGVVNIIDSASEDVVLGNSDLHTGVPLAMQATNSFALSANGNISDVNKGSVAIVSPNILLSTSHGNIGDAIGPSNAAALMTSANNSLNVSSTNGQINIQNDKDLASFSAHATAALSFQNNGNVTLGGDVWGGGLTYFNLIGLNNTLSLNGYQIAASGSTFTIRTDQLVVGTGRIVASIGAELTLTPYTPSGIISLGTATGGLHLSSADLANISAGRLVLGNRAVSGGISLNGVVNFPAYIPDILLLQGHGNGPGPCSFYSSGTLVLSGSRLTIDLDDGSLTSGIITNNGSQNTITFRESGHLVLTGNVDSNGGTVNLSTNAQGTISQTAGMVYASMFNINAEGSVSNINFAAPYVTTTQSGSGGISLTDSVALLGNGISTAGAGGFTFIDTAVGGITTTNSITTSGNLLLQNTNAAPSALTVGAGGAFGAAVTILGNGGLVSINGSTSGTNVSIDARGTGSIIGSGLVSATSSLSLGSNSLLETGSINLTNISSPNVTFNTSGNVTLTDYMQVTGNGASTGANVIFTGANVGGLSTTGSITASKDLTISTLVGSNAPIMIGGSLTGSNVTITSDGSGAITQTGGVVKASLSLSLSTGTGNIVVNNASTPILNLITTGSANVRNSGSGSLTLNTNSPLFANFTLTNDNDLIIASTINSNNAVSITASIGSITFTNSGSSISANGSVVLNSNHVTVPAGTTILGSTVDLNGLTINGNFSAGSNMILDNSGTIQSSAGTIKVTSAAGQDLSLTGNGNGLFVVPTSTGIYITAMGNSLIHDSSILLGPGNMTFVAGSGLSQDTLVCFTAAGGLGSSVTMSTGVSYDFPSDFSNVNINTAKFFGNPGQFTLHTPGHQNNNSTFSINSTLGPGTIANNSGQIDLSQLSNLNFAGQNIAILAATDIVNSTGTPLSINLSSSTGSGGNLSLVAGFNFGPSAANLPLIPLIRTFTLTSGSTVGGSIQLSSVNIDVSGTNGGGTVTAVANQGTASNGSIALGNITSSGGSKQAGSINIIGNGITVGTISNSGTTSANSGSVNISSASSVLLSNASGTQFVSGLLTGGTFLAGPVAASVYVDNINTGQGNVSIIGANISNNSVITSKNLSLNSTGDILLNTAVSGGLTAVAGGNIHIVNTGNIASLIVSSSGQNGTISFTNTGNLMLGKDLSAPGGINLILNSGANFSNNGFLVSTNNNLINLSIDSFTLSGVTKSIDAGTGTVQISPSTPGSLITLGTGTGSGLNLSSAQLSGITAGSLILGSLNTNGGISLGAKIDIFDKYNLQLLQGAGGYFNSNGNALNVGAKSLTINVGGAVNLGNVVTAGANLQITGGSIAINSPIGSATDTISITSLSGDIKGNFVVTAQNLSMSAPNGNICASLTQDGTGTATFAPLTTIVAGSLSVNALGNIVVSNTGDLSSFKANTTEVGSSIIFNNTGNVTLGGDISTGPLNSSTHLTLTLSPHSTLTIDNDHTIKNATFLNITTDSLVLGDVGPAGYNINGWWVNIVPSSAQTPINFGGGPGGLILTNAGLASIIHGAGFSVGSYASTGGINLYGPLNAPNIQFRSGGGFNANGNSVVAALVDVFGNVEIGANSQVGQVNGGSVRLDGSSTIHSVLALSGSITGTGTISGVLALAAYGGSVGPITTASNELGVVAIGGSIDIANTGDLKFSAISTSGSVTLRNTGNVMLTNTGTSDGKVFGNAGALVLIPTGHGDFGIYGRTGVTVVQDSASLFYDNSIRIVATNSPVNLTINSFSSTHGAISSNIEGGYIDAGTGNVSIIPANDNTAINLGNGNAGITLNSYVLNGIYARNLILGSTTATGGININDSMDVSSSFNLQLLQGAAGSVNSVGNTLTLGTKSLNINVGGSANLGSIISSGTNITVNAGSINVSGNIGSATDTLLFNTSSFSTAIGTTVSAGSIRINGSAGSDLNLMNAGTLAASAGEITAVSGTGYNLNISGGGFMNAVNGSIELKATNSVAQSANVVFAGDQTFTGAVAITASGSNQSVSVNDSVTVTGNNIVVLNTNTLNQIGSGTISGNPLVFAASGKGTIANPSGSIDLKGLNLTFNGQSLAIIASGDILNSGPSTTINLAGAGNLNNGGSITIIAGYDFNPQTSSGNAPVSGVFDLGASTGVNSNISLSNVDINTSAGSHGSNGGNVLVVASGSVALGNINTSASAFASTGGSVTVIGNGVTVGTIKTNSPSGISGAVLVNSATPQSVGSVQIDNGVLLSGGFTAAPGSFNGDLAVGSINAGDANISLTTGGTGQIKQSGGGIFSTTGTLSVGSGSKDFNLNTAVSSLQFTAGGSANITNSIDITILSSSTGDKMTITSNGSISVASGQTLSAGSNLTLTSYAGPNNGITINDNVTFSAGSLSGNPAFANVNSAQVQKAGAISLTAFGGAGITLKDQVTLTSNGGNISLTSYGGQNANISMNGTTESLIANGGSISLFGFGQANVGNSNASNTIIQASTFNTFQGGDIKIVGFQGVRIGGGATVEALGNLALGAYNGLVDIVPSNGGTINVGSSVGSHNIGGNTSIFALSGVNIGGNTSIQSNGMFNLISVGASSSLNIGDNVSITSGQLSGGTVKTNGTVFFTVIGSGGINGGTSDAIKVEGGALFINAVGQNANVVFKDGSTLIAEGGGISLFGQGLVEIGAQGGTLGGGIRTTSINGIGGSLLVLAFNGLILGDQTNNSIAGGAFMGNFGDHTQFIIGAGSTTSIGGTAVLGQFGQHSDIEFLGNVSSTGFMNVLALGSTGGTEAKTLLIGNGVGLSSMGGMNFTSVGTGTFNIGASAGAGSTISTTGGGLNIFANGSLTLGNGTSVSTLSSTGTGSSLNILASSISVNGASIIHSDGGLLILNLSQQGFISLGSAQITTAGFTNFVGLGGGITALPGAQLNITGGLNILQTGSGGISFADNTKITVNGGGVNVFSTGISKFGTIGGTSGANVTANGPNASINIIGTNGLVVGDHSDFESDGSLNLSNFGTLTSSLAVGDDSKIMSKHGAVNLSNFNGKGDAQIGSSVTVQAASSAVGSITINGFGVNSGSAINIGANTTFNFSNVSGISINAFNQTGKVVIGDNYSMSGFLNFNSANPTSTPSLNSGIQVLNSVNASFQTNALTPISLLTIVEPDKESLAKLPISVKRSNLGDSVVAVANHGVELHLFADKKGLCSIRNSNEQQESSEEHQAQVYANSNSQFIYTSGGVLHLSKGGVFLNTTESSIVKTDFVEVTARRSALVFVSAFDDSTTVRSCGNNGTVIVKINGKTVSLNSGEELIVSNHKPDYTEIRPSDGVGRRNSRTVIAGSKYITISEFSILTMVSQHEKLFALRKSVDISERRLLARLLKTAATVDAVLKYRGSYRTQ